jgi:hypothetical protein
MVIAGPRLPVLILGQYTKIFLFPGVGGLPKDANPR